MREFTEFADRTIDRLSSYEERGDEVFDNRGAAVSE